MMPIFSWNSIRIRLLSACFMAFIFCSAAFSNTLPEVLLLQQSFHNKEESLNRNTLQRPVQISSQESAEHLSGDLYATVEYGIATIQIAAASSERWCEIMLLLSNTLGCGANAGDKNNQLQVIISSSKTADPTGTTPTEFQLKIANATSDYVNAALLANTGPMGTQNISLRLEAIPLSATRSFVHLHYSYDTHWMGNIAMQAYLQTKGRGKVGFTAVPGADASTTAYIGGTRGVIERNTMRYFLGLDCALALSTEQAPQRFKSMAQCWYGQVEKYPLQLHEMQRTEYLDMKALEYRKLQTTQPRD